MVASGLTPSIHVYDSLLKGFSLKGEPDEIIHMLHQMAAKGIVLDSKITSTILRCICDMSEDLDLAELLPKFAEQQSKEICVPCDALLIKIQKSLHKRQTCSA
ncbi:unnamed protein product [Cuscuta epithymum]|nr:unnamed protein product [Cuscuta epithymum]